MNNPIRDINWIESSPLLDSLLSDKSLSFEPLDSGLEAEVAKISNSESSAVLKIWNRTSKPNVELQYKLLKALHSRGISVSNPLGYGLENDNPVLLTSYDGSSIQKIDQSLLVRLARILSDIHHFPVEEHEHTIFQKNEFISYFFPAIDDHQDIRILLDRLVKESNMKQERLIHGDFHLGNILHNNGKYTIIDWTNGQLGDPRYDIAWTVILARIYVSERYGLIFLNSCLSFSDYSPEELELFEAIACLRWVLLNRITNLPIGKDTIKRVRNILKNNIYLHKNFL